MPREVEITRDEVVVVDTVETIDGFGKLAFSDKGGGFHTINQKHSSLHPLIQEGKAVHLFYGEYMNNEFIHKAELVEGKLPPSQPTKTETGYPDEPPPEELAVNPTATAVKSTASVVKPPAPQEVGLWWKEVGLWLREGKVKADTAWGKSLRNSYFNEMKRVLPLIVVPDDTGE